MEDHKILLQKFFNEKKKNDRKKILEKKAQVRSKKTLQYNVQHDKFSLVDQNGNEMISVVRNPKRSIFEMLGIYDEQIHQTRHELLQTKYRILYEYEPITSLNTIEPMEKKLDVFIRKQKKMSSVQVKQSKENKLDELRLKLEPLKEQLKGAHTIEEKKVYIKEYTQMRKEIVDFMKVKEDDIQEIKLQANEEELFSPSSVQQEKPIELSPIVIEENENSSNSNSNNDSENKNENSSNSNNDSENKNGNSSNSNNDSENKNENSNNSNSNNDSENEDENENENENKNEN